MYSRNGRTMVRFKKYNDTEKIIVQVFKIIIRNNGNIRAKENLWIYFFSVFFHEKNIRRRVIG